MCWCYNRQYGIRYLAAMPSNLYDPGDNHHPENSHVIMALIRKFQATKVGDAPAVSVWGTGTLRREFKYSNDMADVCIHPMNLADATFNILIGSDEAASGIFIPLVVNIGVGTDITIKELAETVKGAVGYTGHIEFDTNQPDGTPCKLMDASRLHAPGWQAKIRLKDGLVQSYDACRIAKP